MQRTDLYTITIPPMMKTLRSLSGILDKLAEHAESKQLQWHTKGLQEGNLLNDKLVFDQFPFIKQVQVACDNGKGGAGRLAGVEAPKMEDSEKTVADLKARIEKTLEFMASIKPEQVIGQEERTVTLPYWPDKPMTAFGYATEYLMPNFYFHVATAYSILRKNGVDVGKMDYLGSVPFLE